MEGHKMKLPSSLEEVFSVPFTSDINLFMVIISQSYDIKMTSLVNHLPFITCQYPINITYLSQI